jgi:hypothetical protein
VKTHGKNKQRHTVLWKTHGENRSHTLQKMRPKSLQRAEKALRRLRLRRIHKNQTLLMAKQKGYRQKNTLASVGISFDVREVKSIHGLEKDK